MVNGFKVCAILFFAQLWTADLMAQSWRGENSIGNRSYNSSHSRSYSSSSSKHSSSFGDSRKSISSSSSSSSKRIRPSSNFSSKSSRSSSIYNSGSSPSSFRYKSGSSQSSFKNNDKKIKRIFPQKKHFGNRSGHISKNGRVSSEDKSNKSNLNSRWSNFVNNKGKTFGRRFKSKKNEHITISKIRRTRYRVNNNDIYQRKGRYYDSPRVGISPIYNYSSVHVNSSMRSSILPIGRYTVDDTSQSTYNENVLSKLNNIESDRFKASMLDLAQDFGLPFLTKNDILVLYPLSDSKRRRMIKKWAHNRLVLIEVIGEGTNIKDAKNDALQNALQETCGQQKYDITNNLDFEEIPNSGRVMNYKVLIEDETNRPAYTKLDVCIYVGPINDNQM